MAYSGYLLKVGEYTFPLQTILYGTYKAAPKVQDWDSYRDANGVLHRNVIDHVPIKVEFEVRRMTNTVYESIMDNIRAAYTKPKERKTTITAFIPELNEYVTQAVYLVEPEITILRQVDSSTLVYDKMRFAFVGY